MATNEPEDFIAQQGTDGLRLCIDLSDMIDDQGMQIANLEHAVQELQQLLPKSDMPTELVEIRAARESLHTYFLSVPVFVDTPGLACFDDFANALCSGNPAQGWDSRSSLFDWMSVSPSSWSEAHKNLSELRLKRQMCLRGKMREKMRKKKKNLFNTR